LGGKYETSIDAAFQYVDDVSMYKLHARLSRIYLEDDPEIRLWKKYLPFKKFLFLIAKITKFTYKLTVLKLAYFTEFIFLGHQID
jgi:hypothetical protein